MEGGPGVGAPYEYGCDMPAPSSAPVRGEKSWKPAVSGGKPAEGRLLSILNQVEGSMDIGYSHVVSSWLDKFTDSSDSRD